ncbi:SIS domain-containing protein [Schumannella luteola]|uniref:Fructoselysine-6-P-deglycase FrlB-like protein n=1 Tax=Schumannella luteola TaxID=472059 RepID=A0A852YGV2_9MICO|nr:SIS domain-containing protein [Schumannella luteola]NYH00521.1 fructoselysine-6-P-deglycase FrlB-like protein [Schumannella luteola]TPX06224.1 SIS domain-containing protein [Schumannella luteola]
MSITDDEIATQPRLWREALAGLDQARELLAAPGEKVLVIGCGTSAFVAESLAFLREEAGHGVTDAGYASEPRAWRDWDRVVAITRSGTTTEVIAALREVPAGVRRVVVTGVADSPVAEFADDILDLAAADEKSVVQTRFPTTFLTLARAALGYDVEPAIAAVEEALALPLPVDLDGLDHFVYLGTGWTYGLAQEAALKIREAAQAWSESYPVLDYRHGPLAVAHPGSLVWLFGSADAALADDIRRTGARVLLGSAEPLVDLVQAQRLAVAIAAQRGLDPDQPRHLTRSIILS